VKILITEKQFIRLVEDSAQSPCPSGKAEDALITVDDVKNGKSIQKGYCNSSPNSIIVQVQKKLKDLNYLTWSGPLGYYGDSTAEALKNFYLKQSCSRQVDGTMIGKNVWESLLTPDRYNRYHSNLDIIAATLWGEARGESKQGQIAIYNILKNRARKSGGTSLKQIAAECLKPYQFSYWNDKGFLKDPKCAKGSLGVEPKELTEFKNLVNSNPSNNIGQSTHYVNKKYATTKNKWWENKEKFKFITKIGDHEFYQEL
jgi:hypothetical protein